MTIRSSHSPLDALLSDPRIRTLDVDGRRYFSAADVVALLLEGCDAPIDDFPVHELEPIIRADGAELLLDNELSPMLTLTGVMRAIQLVDSPKAARLRNGMAAIASRQIEEQGNPELTVQRLRRSYEARGYPRRWIDQRVRSISARQELVNEWHSRGVNDSGQFRELTNKLMEATFGMDVNGLRRFKGIEKNLRDRLGTMELSLVSLAESVAAAFHRERQSRGMDELTRDLIDAGRIVGQTRSQIERAMLLSGKAA